MASKRCIHHANRSGMSGTYKDKRRRRVIVVLDERKADDGDVDAVELRLLTRTIVDVHAIRLVHAHGMVVGAEVLSEDELIVDGELEASARVLVRAGRDAHAISAARGHRGK